MSHVLFLRFIGARTDRLEYTSSPKCSRLDPFLSGVHGLPDPSELALEARATSSDRSRQARRWLAGEPPAQARGPGAPSSLLALWPAAQPLSPKAGPGSGSNAGPGKVLPGVRVGWSSRPSRPAHAPRVPLLFFLFSFFLLPLSSLSI
jgi:hypothetical protein